MVNFFLPGDACGYVRDNDTTPSSANNLYQFGNDYFYGLAPGVTASLSNFPNATPTTMLNSLADVDIHSQSGFGPLTDVIHSLQGQDVYDDSVSGDFDVHAIKFNRSQTPYFFYFGLIPGKTSLHKTVGKFFADKINAVTLQGIKAGNPTENQHNQPNIQNPVKNLYSIYKTCLGEAKLPILSGGFVATGETVYVNAFVPCTVAFNPPPINVLSIETFPGASDGEITVSWINGTPPYTITWSALNNTYNTPPTINNDFYALTTNATSLSTDTYQIKIVDGDGCQDTITVFLDEGALTCCQKTRLVDAKVVDISKAYGKKFCWVPCDDTTITNNSSYTYYPSQPPCATYATPPDTNYGACGTPKLGTTSGPTINGLPSRCATYPSATQPPFPVQGYVWPMEWGICTCEDIVDTAGVPIDPGVFGIEFGPASSGNQCEDVESRIPNKVTPGAGPCNIIEPVEAPLWTSESIDFEDLWGTIIDNNGVPTIQTGAPVHRIEVEVPEPINNTGTFGTADCACPTRLNLSVYGGTLTLDTTQKLVAYDSLVAQYPATPIFNGGLPCVRVMARVMKPGYDVCNYARPQGCNPPFTTCSFPTGIPGSMDPAYPNIVVGDIGIQRALDYTKQCWFDNNCVPWNGQPTTWLTTGQYTGTSLSSWFSNLFFGEFQGATPPLLGSSDQDSYIPPCCIGGGGALSKLSKIYYKDWWDSFNPTIRIPMVPPNR